MRLSRAILTLFLMSYAAVPRAQGQVMSLGGRSVTLTFVDPQDMSPVPWASGAVSLATVTGAVTGTDTVYSLLQSSGIMPDSEALTLVYDLNPGLSDVRTLSAGAAVLLPRITPPSALQEIKQKGYLARVNVDPEIRDRLNVSIQALQAIQPSANQVSSPATQEKLAKIAEWYGQVARSYRRRTGPPLRRQTLLQLSNEAVALTTLLQSAQQAKRDLSGDDEAQVGAIYQDLERVMRAYGQTLGNEPPKAEGECTVTVNIQGNSPKLLSQLRVYYTFNGLYREPPVDPPVTSTPFTQLGSGQSARFVAAKIYKIWAARDGHPGQPLSPPLRFENGCDANTVTLSLEEQ